MCEWIQGWSKYSFVSIILLVFMTHLYDLRTFNSNALQCKRAESEYGAATRYYVLINKYAYNSYSVCEKLKIFLLRFSQFN